MNEINYEFNIIKFIFNESTWETIRRKSKATWTRLTRPMPNSATIRMANNVTVPAKRTSFTRS